MHQASMLLASISAFLLQFATKYGYLIIFSAVYGFSDGVFIATQCFILLSCVDAKRTTASFCINNVLYSFTAAAGGPIAGELICNSFLTSKLFHKSWDMIVFEVLSSVG